MTGFLILLASSTLTAPPPLVRGPVPVNPGATDVPQVSRPVPDRPPLEDPTAASLAQRTIFTPFPNFKLAMGYFKLTIPQPNEFVDQLKSQLPREKDFGLTPVVIPPEKK